MCGESWLAVKDSLTHRPISQGWASKCPIIYFFPCINFVQFVHYVYCVCLGYLSFLPTSALVSVLCTCIYVYVHVPQTDFVVFYVVLCYMRQMQRHVY